MEDQAQEWENQEYEENDRSWIWNEGLRLGKRIFVAGFVLSSAPVILPPLMVFSAIGLACSVPCGIFLTSYVVTRKLVNKLLPIPSNISEENYGGEEAVKENQEEELIRRAEMKPESDEKVNEEEKSSKEIEMIIEGIGENKIEEPMIEGSRSVEICKVTLEIEEGEKTGSNVLEEELPLEVTSMAVELRLGDNNEDNEELLKETTGLIEKFRDEGMVEEEAGKEKQSAENVHGSVEEGLKKADTNVGETVVQSRDENADSTVVVDKKVEQNGVKNNGAVESAPAVRKKKASSKRAGNNIKEKGKSVAGEAAALQEERAEDNKANHVKKGLTKDEEIGISSIVDAKEIADESGFNLYDAKNAAQMQSSTDYGVPEGNKQSSCTPQKNADSLEVTIGGTPSNEVLCSEEMMWNQIDAVRKIIGYTAARHAICVEEVKALYVFTGVEPPASFRDASDLVEVNEKLKYLMSVIGVK